MNKINKIKVFNYFIKMLYIPNNYTSVYAFLVKI
jgi:hypothetical protein